MPGHLLFTDHPSPIYLTAVVFLLLFSWVGSATAEYQNGLVAYFSGDYVTERGDAKNLAFMWFSLATAQGTEGASANLRRLARVMTPTQMVEAEKLARDWKSK